MKYLVFILFIVLPVALFAQFPEITVLDRQDPLYLQLTQDIMISYQRQAKSEDNLPLLFYQYSLKDGDDIYRIAARFSLPLATISTVNGLHSNSLEGLAKLFIVNQPGVFVPKEAINSLERAMTSRLAEKISQSREIQIPSSNGTRAGYFIPGESFSPSEHRQFLQVLFRNPLPDSRLSSTFGYRIDPISGRRRLHQGIDMVMSLGTDVIASSDGKVIAKGFDIIYGNYIELEHSGGFSTYYAHLNSISVLLNAQIRSGEVLGTVGNTGYSTGAHLHFEIRQNGDPIDPLLHIF